MLPMLSSILPIAKAGSCRLIFFPLIPPVKNLSSEAGRACPQRADEPSIPQHRSISHSRGALRTGAPYLLLAAIFCAAASACAGEIELTLQTRDPVSGKIILALEKVDPA